MAIFSPSLDARTASALTKKVKVKVKATQGARYHSVEFRKGCMNCTPCHESNKQGKFDNLGRVHGRRGMLMLQELLCVEPVDDKVHGRQPCGDFESSYFRMTR